MAFEAHGWTETQAGVLPLGLPGGPKGTLSSPGGTRSKYGRNKKNHNQKVLFHGRGPLARDGFGVRGGLFSFPSVVAAVDIFIYLGARRGLTLSAAAATHRRTTLLPPPALSLSLVASATPAPATPPSGER